MLLRDQPGEGQQGQRTAPQPEQGKRDRVDQLAAQRLPREQGVGGERHQGKGGQYGGGHE
jgi:hypothetical protein